MRALKTVSTTFFLMSSLASGSALGLEQTIGLQFGMSQQPLFTDAENPDEAWLQYLPEQQNLTLSHELSNLFEVWSTRTDLTYIRRNTDKILITNRRGVERPYSDLSGDRDSVKLGLDISRAIGQAQVHVTGSSTLGADAFASRSFGFGAQWNSFEYGLRAELEFQRTIAERPETAYLRGYRTEFRPPKTTSDITTLALEQLILERTKVRLEAIALDNRTERPLALGARGRVAHALTDSIFVEGSARYLRELRNEELKNDRGYFDLRDFSIGASYEPILDLVFESEVGVQYEFEKDRPVGGDQELETRMAGLGVKWSRSQPEVNLGVRFFQLETQESFYALQGGISWSIAD